MVETQTDYAKLTTAFVHVFEGILHCSLLSQHSTLVSEGSYRGTWLAGGFAPTLTQLAIGCLKLFIFLLLSKRDNIVGIVKKNH